MSTRALLLRPTDPGEAHLGAGDAVTLPSDWIGAYVHHDGYPSGLGATLRAIVQAHDGLGDLVAAWLIGQHPAGWATLGATEDRRSFEPGWIGVDLRTLHPTTGRPLYGFAYGDRPGEGIGPWHHLTPYHGDPGVTELWSVEWVYVLWPDCLAVHATTFHGDSCRIDAPGQAVSYQGDPLQWFI